MTTKAFAAPAAAEPLAEMTIERRPVGASDVAIEILFCGVCHSDLHTARGEWDGVRFPVVPGHEIVGRVTAVGEEVRRVAPGDLVGVGCMVGSCRTCASCEEGLEQYCEGPHGFQQTYSGWLDGWGETTHGGYAADIVVDEHFVLKVSHAEADLAGVAPLLCAGITTWSPLRHWGAGEGRKVGVVGIGGLGHMALKLAHALGAHVVAFTTSESKRDDALRLGADEVVLSRDGEAMAAHARSFDLIIDAAAASHNLDDYIALLRRDGALVLLGAPDKPHPSPSVFPMLLGRRAIAGTAIGGIAETQEMLDFCAEHGIVADVETIAIDEINSAYERLVRGDVKYRFVIDMASLA